jgi:hypothetical protein
VLQAAGQTNVLLGQSLAVVGHIANYQFQPFKTQFIKEPSDYGWRVAVADGPKPLGIANELLERSPAFDSLKPEFLISATRLLNQGSLHRGEEFRKVFGVRNETHLRGHFFLTSYISFRSSSDKIESGP